MHLKCCTSLCASNSYRAYILPANNFLGESNKAALPISTTVTFIFLVLLIVFGGRSLLSHGCCFVFEVSKCINSTFRDFVSSFLCCLHLLVDDNLAGIPRASPIPSPNLFNNEAVVIQKKRQQTRVRVSSDNRKHTVVTNRC